MQPVLDNHRAEIATLCRQFGVRRLEVFGSAIRSDYDNDASDIDLVVEFEPERSGGQAFARYFDLKRALEELLHKSVDLVELSALDDTRLRRIIERSKVPFYAATP